ncbi:hypothetical protein [Homoserinimonas sp. A520]
MPMAVREWPLVAPTEKSERLASHKIELDIDVPHQHGSRNGVGGPVDKAVFDYTVGGMNVILSWFKYRTMNPGGKKTS